MAVTWLTLISLTWIFPPSPRLTYTWHLYLMCLIVKVNMLKTVLSIHYPLQKKTSRPSQSIAPSFTQMLRPKKLEIIPGFSPFSSLLPLSFLPPAKSTESQPHLPYKLLCSHASSSQHLFWLGRWQQTPSCSPSVYSWPLQSMLHRRKLENVIPLFKTFLWFFSVVPLE